MPLSFSSISRHFPLHHYSRLLLLDAGQYAFTEDIVFIGFCDYFPSRVSFDMAFFRLIMLYFSFFRSPPFSALSSFCFFACFHFQSRALCHFLGRRLCICAGATVKAHCFRQSASRAISRAYFLFRRTARLFPARVICPRRRIRFAAPSSRRSSMPADAEPRRRLNAD